MMNVELSETELIATIQFDVAKVIKTNPNLYQRAALRVTYPDRTSDSDEQAYNPESQTFVMSLSRANIGVHEFGLSFVANTGGRSPYLKINKTRGMSFYIMQ